MMATRAPGCAWMTGRGPSGRSLQASQARIPQLQKVVLALGDRIIYEDTYEKALAQLAGVPAPAPAVPGAPPATTPAPNPAGNQSVLQTVREHLRRYRELAGQGRFAEAGKELEAAEAAVK